MCANFPVSKFVSPPRRREWQDKVSRSGNYVKPSEKFISPRYYPGIFARLDGQPHGITE